MDLASEVPAPESIGVGGYVWCTGFDPQPFEVKPGFPSIVSCCMPLINYIPLLSIYYIYHVFWSLH